jgi:hypothetical protein
VTATEGAGAGYFQIWGGVFYPTTATITGFNNGLIAINGTTFSGTTTFNNSWVQASSASFWTSTLNLNGCTAYVGACATDGGATFNIDSGTTLTADADFLGAIILNNSGGSVINTTKALKAVPAASIGKVGDVAGDAAIDNTYLYYCTAAYDGSTSIWKRQTLTGATW